jgi:hypothetical protein
MLSSNLGSDTDKPKIFVIFLSPSEQILGSAHVIESITNNTTRRTTPGSNIATKTGNQNTQ